MTTQERFDDLVLWVKTHDLEGIELSAHEVHWHWAWPSTAHETVYHSDGRLEGVPGLDRWDGNTCDTWERVFGPHDLLEPWRRLSRFEELRRALRGRSAKGAFGSAGVLGWYPNPRDRTRFIAFQKQGAVRGSRRLSRWDTLPREQWELVLAAAVG